MFLVHLHLVLRVACLNAPPSCFYNVLSTSILYNVHAHIYNLFLCTSTFYDVCVVSAYCSFCSDSRAIHLLHRAPCLKFFFDPPMAPKAKKRRLVGKQSPTPVEISDDNGDEGGDGAKDGDGAEDDTQFWADLGVRTPAQVMGEPPLGTPRKQRPPPVEISDDKGGAEISDDEGGGETSDDEGGTGRLHNQSPISGFASPLVEFLDQDSGLDPWVFAQEIYGITSRELMLLIHMRAPAIIFELLLTLTACSVLPISQHDLVDGVEYFSGVAQVQKQIQKVAMSCLAYDKDYDAEGMDLLTDLGFVTAFVWACRLKRYGLTAWGTLCSSWIWVSRSVTKRSPEQVLGDISVPFVAQGNVMVSRMCLIWHIVKMKECLYILEQPQSSLMFRHPRVLGWNVKITNTWMGCFNAPTAKPTKLASNVWEVVARLHRVMTGTLRASLSSEGVTTSESDLYGRSRRISGGPKLKGTQAYTPEFATAVVSSWRTWVRDQQWNDDQNGTLHPTAFQDDPNLEKLMASRAFPRLHMNGWNPTVDNWLDAEVSHIPRFIIDAYSPVERR